MNAEKTTLDEVINYFKGLADTYEVCSRATAEESQKQWYLGKSEAYKLAAFELEQNLL